LRANRIHAEPAHFLDPQESWRGEAILWRSSAVGASRVKFTCQRCAAKYSIGDDKVKGKILRIRCKRCGFIIEVRDAALAPAQDATLEKFRAGMSQEVRSPAPASDVDAEVDRAFGRVVAKPVVDAPRTRDGAASFDDDKTVLSDVGKHFAAATAKPALEWFLAIDGRQHGPLTLENARHKISSLGARAPKAYGWREGMKEWRRIPDVPELQVALPRAPVPPPPPAAAKSSPGVGRAKPITGSSLASSLAAAARVVHREHRLEVIPEPARVPSADAAKAPAPAPTPAIVTTSPTPIEAARAATPASEAGPTPEAASAAAPVLRAVAEPTTFDAAPAREPVVEAAPAQSPGQPVAAEKQIAPEWVRAPEPATEDAPLGRSVAQPITAEAAVVAALAEIESERTAEIVEPAALAVAQFAREEPKEPTAATLGEVIPASAKSDQQTRELLEKTQPVLAPPQGETGAVEAPAAAKPLGEVTPFPTIEEPAPKDAPARTLSIIDHDHALSPLAPAARKFPIAATIALALILGAGGVLVLGVLDVIHIPFISSERESNVRGPIATVPAPTPAATLLRRDPLFDRDAPRIVVQAAEPDRAKPAAQNGKRAASKKDDVAAPQAVASAQSAPADLSTAAPSPRVPASATDPAPEAAPAAPAPKAAHLSELERRVFGGGTGTTAAPAIPAHLIAKSTAPTAEREGLTQEAVTRILKRYRGGVQSCYQKQLKKDSSVRGRLTLSLKIGKNGKVLDASVESSMRSTLLADCVIAIARTWRFPPSSSEVDIDYPLILEATQ
jgi:predicted Zn finger-like uncharacterized protein